MKFVSNILKMTLLFWLSSCGKENHTGFTKGDYSKQKLNNLEINYSQNDQGVTESKTLNNSELTLEKITYSDDYKKLYYEQKQKILKELLEESKSHSPQFQQSFIQENRVKLNIDYRLKYENEIAICNEMELIRNQTVTKENDTIRITSDITRDLEEINEVSNLNTATIKNLHPLCLKIPKFKYVFSLAKIEKYNKEEILTKLNEEIKNIKPEDFQERNLEQSFDKIMNLKEHPTNLYEYHVIFYEYFPLNLNLEQQMTFNWTQSKVTIDSRDSNYYNLLAKNPLEIINIKQLTPYKTEDVSKEHFTNNVIIPRDDYCSAFVLRFEEKINGRQCEKRPAKYEDRGFDLYTINEKINYESKQLDSHSTNKIIGDFFQKNIETSSNYFLIKNKNNFKSEAIEFNLNFKKYREHYNKRIEHIEAIKRIESAPIIFQIEVLKHFDNWKLIKEQSEITSS